MISSILDTRNRRRATWLAAVAVAGLLPGATVRAQDAPAETPPQTHTVKKGDTLWDLGRIYLNDPFLWPEIYRLNTDVVEDPHWIYPDEVLRIPTGLAPVSVQDPLVPATVALDQPPAAPPGQTVFAADMARRHAIASRFGGSAGTYPRTAVRPGEFYAAPWLDRPGGPAHAGTIVAAADIPGIAQSAGRARLTTQERAYITLPDGVVPARGDRFLVYRLGPRLGERDQVVVPTGVVEVERADNGDATTVRVTQMFGVVEVGQGVVPLERFSLPLDARPAPLLLGTEATVVYLPDAGVLPALGDYVLLDATERDGVRLGDQFTLYRPRTRVVTAAGAPVVLPEERIALAQVVKVTPRGATALLVDMAQPAVKEHVRARLTARMP